MIPMRVADVYVRPDNDALTLRWAWTARPCTRAAAAFYHSAMGPESDDWAVDDQLAELGRVLLKRVVPLARARAHQIIAEVAFYREQPTVSTEELRDSCHAHLDYVLGSLGAPATRGLPPRHQSCPAPGDS